MRRVYFGRLTWLFLFLSLFLLLSPVPLLPTVQAPPKPSLPVLLVIAPRDFQPIEFFACKNILEKEGFKTKVASTTKGPTIGMDKKTKIVPDIVIDNAKEKDYLAIVIIGGTGSRQYLWENKKLHALVKAFYDKKKVVGAICISPAVLALAGLLKGREATVYPDPVSVGVLKQNGAKYMDAPVVVSGKIITGRDPKAAEEFAKTIVKILKGK